jgi:hypothetical protein
MQRLNQKDVSSFIIEQDLNYTHLCLPMEYEGPKPATSIGFVDPHFPSRAGCCSPNASPGQWSIGIKIMSGIRRGGQFVQQRPSPATGSVIQPT